MGWLTMTNKMICNYCQYNWRNTDRNLVDPFLFWYAMGEVNGDYREEHQELKQLKNQSSGYPLGK